MDEHPCHCMKAECCNCGGVSWPNIYCQNNSEGKICKNVQYSRSTPTKVNCTETDPFLNDYSKESSEKKVLEKSTTEEIRKCMQECITESGVNSLGSSISSVTPLVIFPVTSTTEKNANECSSHGITIMQNTTDSSNNGHTMMNKGNENLQISWQMEGQQNRPKEINRSRFGGSSGSAAQKENPEHIGIRRLTESLHFYRCNFCEAKFFSVTGLKMHTQCKHEPSKNYACCFCSYVGKCKNSLITHVSRQHNKKFQCKDCDYSSSFEGGLERHRRLVHSEEERHFPCQHCSYRGAKRRHLLEHEKLFHNSDVSRYSCPICGKHFKTQVLMKHHLISHTDRQLYSCRGCNYRTRHRQTLYHHIKRVHAGKSLKNLCSGPTEEDFQAIIKTATQELAAKEQRVAEDCLLLSNQNFSEVDHSSCSFLSNHCADSWNDSHSIRNTVLEPNANTDYLDSMKQMSEASGNANQSLAIMDGASFSGDDVSRIVTMTHNLIERSELLETNGGSEKEAVQLTTHFEDVVNTKEEKQTFTSLERMETCNPHVEFMNYHGADINNINDLTQTVNHVNFTQKGLVSTDNVIILPVPSSGSQIIPNNDVQHGAIQSGFLYQSSLLDITPQQVLESRYETDNNWNSVVFQVDETAK